MYGVDDSFYVRRVGVFNNGGGRHCELRIESKFKDTFALFCRVK